MFQALETNRIGCDLFFDVPPRPEGHKDDDGEQERKGIEHIEINLTMVTFAAS